MSFEDQLRDFERRFEHGEVTWAADEALRPALRRARVPEVPGVYVLFAGPRSVGECKYIGKAGTVTGNGSFKAQKLLGRLSAKQKGISREAYFRSQLIRTGCDAMTIRWFVTWTGSIGIAPAAAEAQLMQAFLDEFRCLPSWNRAF